MRTLLINVLEVWRLGLLVVIAVLVTVRPAPGDEAVDFNRDIRPILSDKCYHCHGPNDDDRQGGLRLDQKDSAQGEAESGSVAIVPGDVDKSEIVRRITAEDEEERMPPPESNKKLSADEIDLIRRWIQQGATWREHWAFVRPKQSAKPKVRNSQWPRNSIDHYILARLEDGGFTPSTEAEKSVLIRRVTFDLTGLPPTPAEVDSYLADSSPYALEKVVDRLLKSPRYGEHMARFWLDAVRYGDTHGLHLDNYREMWPYRDWVVRAFNDNMPFDQFVIQQLAGDLLPDASLDQQIASGFNRCHVTTAEGGSIRREVHVRNVVDRVVTTGTVFMGMTLDCTRCHDHKYDPLTMRDFYSLFAFFNSIDGDPLDGNRKDPAPIVRIYSDEQKQQLVELASRIQKIEARLKEFEPQIVEALIQWEEGLRQGTSDESFALNLWQLIGPFNGNDSFDQSFGPEKDTDLAKTHDGRKWAERKDLVDGKVHGLGAERNSATYLFRSISSNGPLSLPISLGSDDGIKVWLNGDLVLAKNASRNAAPDQEKVNLSLRKGQNFLLLKVVNGQGGSAFYFKTSTGGELPGTVRAVIAVDAKKRTEKQKEQLQKFFLANVHDGAETTELGKQLKQLQGRRKEIESAATTTLVYRETKKPRPSFILKRGEYDRKGDEVPRATPAMLPPMPAELPRDRHGLAQWLVDPGHPLTARVAVNRFWQQMFGVGIVKTSDDFGSQGEPPSHPKLLDWMATEFIESGWNTKQLMKTIVTSATYRQTSRFSPQHIERDPVNRLLARGPRFRLDAEMLRDQALAVSGLLVPRMGGPSVKPPQPDGLWYAVGYTGSDTVRFKKDSGPDKVHRRSLYTFIKRTAPPPQMSTFDAPSRESTCVRRERTNTPLQSLLLMNDLQCIEAARGLAQRAMRQGRRPRERLDFIYRMCTARHADDVVVTELLGAYKDLLASYEADADAAQQLVNVGELKPDAQLNVPRLAAWTMVANLVLNLDEVLNKN